MKKITRACTLIIAILFFTGYSVTAQTTASTDNSKNINSNEMKTYLIERDIPDAGKLTPEQLKSISQKSISVLKEMAPDILYRKSLYLCFPVLLML